MEISWQIQQVLLYVLPQVHVPHRCRFRHSDWKLHYRTFDFEQPLARRNRHQTSKLRPTVDSIGGVMALVEGITVIHP